MLFRALAVPSVVMVMGISPTPQAERAMIELVSIYAGIVAVDKMDAVVGTVVGEVAGRNAEVVEAPVGVTLPDTQAPRMAYHIEGAEEVVAPHKPAVLTATEHVHEVFVAHVEQVVIVVYGVVVSVYHIVYHLIRLVEEIEVDLVDVVVLAVRQSELVAHTVGKEACLATHVGNAHRCPTLCTDSCQGYKHEGCSHRFHHCSLLFF